MSRRKKYVYIIGGDIGPVKIGVSVKPRARLFGTLTLKVDFLNRSESRWDCRPNCASNFISRHGPYDFFFTSGFATSRAG